MWSTTSSIAPARRVDVLAVERRDVLRVQQLDDLARDSVALVLARLDLALAHLAVRNLLEAALREPGDLEHVLARPREQVVERGRPRGQCKAHGAE